MHRQILIPLLGAFVGTLVACGGESLTLHPSLTGAEDGRPGPAEALSGQQLAEGTEFLALANASLRREPSASAAVLAVVPRDATVEVLEGANLGEPK
jgi:hypothetical protein